MFTLSPCLPRVYAPSRLRPDRGNFPTLRVTRSGSLQPPPCARTLTTPVTSSVPARTVVRRFRTAGCLSSTRRGMADPRCTRSARRAGTSFTRREAWNDRPCPRARGTPPTAAPLSVEQSWSGGLPRRGSPTRVRVECQPLRAAVARKPITWAPPNRDTGVGPRVFPHPRGPNLLVAFPHQRRSPRSGVLRSLADLRTVVLRPNVVTGPAAKPRPRRAREGYPGRQ